MIVTYQVVTKKNPACHVRYLKGADSGSQVARAGGGDLVIAINMYVCCTTMAIASPTNAAAAHNNGVFPLPLYTHSYFSPFPLLLVPTHVTCNKIQHKKY